VFSVGPVGERGKVGRNFSGKRREEGGVKPLLRPNDKVFTEIRRVLGGTGSSLRRNGGTNVEPRTPRRREVPRPKTLSPDCPLPVMEECQRKCRTVLQNPGNSKSKDTAKKKGGRKNIMWGGRKKRSDRT